MEIPIVDFEGFINGKNKQEVSKELINVVKNYGFVYLRNYGISTDLVDKMFKLSKLFFEKPLDYKNSVKKSHETFCGYDALLEEKLTNDRPGDLKESYMMKSFGTPWPSDWNDFKEFMQLFHDKCYQLALQILTSFAIGLELDPTIFATKFSNGECTILRLLHYPPLPDQIEDKQIRAGEHTDYGAVTILFQDSIGGLEVKSLDNKWIPAPYHENTVLINVGDVMEMWTNGCLRSTPHRVVNPTDADKKLKPRFSTALFCDPDLETKIECIDKFVSEENPAKYPPVFYRDHLFGKFKATYKY
jgi:isopenicillin N synthase-like dioxygenase